MKKYLLLTLILVLALTAFLSFKYYSPKKQVDEVKTESVSKEIAVKLVLDYGNNNTNSYDLKAKEDVTAFSALKTILEKENIYLETVQYDFGVFVKKIGDLESGAKKSWIYYVNNKSGEIAADKQQLKEGDEVKWAYEVPKF